MKKTITYLSLFITVAVMTLGFTSDQQLTVIAPQGEWQKHINKLEIVRNIVDNADLSNQQTKFITRTIDSLELMMIPQLQKQISDSTKKN